MRAAEARSRLGPPPWAALASVSVSAALLNLAASLLAAPRALRFPEPMLSVLAVSALLYALLYLALWGTLALLARRVAIPRLPLLAGLSAALVCAATLAPLLDWWGEGHFSRGQTLLLVANVAVGVAGVAAWAWRSARDAEPGGTALRLCGLAVRVGPWLAALTLAYVWMQVRWIGSWLSLDSILASAAWGALCAATTLAFRQRALGSPRLLAAAAAAALLAPALVRGVASVGFAPASAGASCAVLLSIDTLRADALRAYRRGAGAHPHLDRLLNDSLVFLEARSSGPWTKPAFASALTGLSPWVHRANNARAGLPREVVTLAERFQQAGYETVAIGRNSSLTDAFAFDQGFDRYDFHPRGSLGAASGAKLLTAVGAHHRSLDTRQLTDRAVDWVRGAAEPPFFLWLHYFDPHQPYVPPESFLPEGRAPERIGVGFTARREVRNGSLRPTPEEQGWIRELYQAELRFVDAQVGRFLGALKERGLYDACLVAFMSDHGEEFWEHGGYEHGHTLYDELLRVPLAIKLPGSSRKGPIETPVSTASLFATLLELTGLEPGDGVAPPLTSLWREPAADLPAPAVVSTGMAYGEPMRSVVFDGFKYIEASDRRELYHLASDPGERRPLERETEILRGRALLAAHERSAREARAALGLPKGSARELDPEVRAELVALGYLE